MKIVHAASELFPFVKTGGLADVVGALSKSLAEFGHDVSIFLPGYRKILEAPEFKKAKLVGTLQIEMAKKFLRSEVYAIELAPRRVLYVIRRDEFFERSNPYGYANRDYDDNDQRFIYFCKAIVEAMHVLEIKSDILHCHDWQTGLAPLYLRIKERSIGKSLALKTFFSIHNLAFQGLFPGSSFRITNLPREFNALDGIEFYEQISLIKGGIFFADKIMTVSPSYAEEILTPEFGCGMNGALETRGDDLVGIANGIDTDVWNPDTDPALPANYSAKNLAGKAACRSALLKAVGLTESAAPVYGMVCRLTQQKGVELLLKNLDFFARNDCRVVILGTGDPALEEAVSEWTSSNSKYGAISMKLDEPMSHLVEAGCDFYLMPSIFEPCGLNQMYSQRYGSVPLVTRVGGLKDTVTPVGDPSGKGAGIVFEPTVEGLASGLERSLALFKDKASYLATQQNGMLRDFSWKNVARQYENLYLGTI